MRSVRHAGVALVLAAALALTGCAGSSSSLGGDAVNSVSVTGTLGSAPDVQMPTPLVLDSTECKELIAGDGVALEDGQLLKIELSIYNGSTGKLIEQTSYNDSDSQGLVLSDQLLPGLRNGLKCATLGSRVVMVIPPADAFGDAGNSQWGIAGNDSLVIVADVTRAYLARANGTAQLSQDGMPMVVLAPNGQPGITVPKGDAPTDERISVLKKGSGATVQSGDTVTVHYTGALWADGTIFDSSWTKGQPTQFKVGNGTTDQGEVIQGFSDALIGQTVGSQVLAVIPPALGYGDQAAGSIPAGSTLVFVVDILGVN